MITLTLTEPPGVNALWRVRKGAAGIYSTPEYKAWLKSAGWEIVEQGKHRGRISGPYMVSIEMSDASRLDVDATTKGILDLLKHHITDDDRHCKQVVTLKVPAASLPAGKCRVHVAEW